MSKRTEIEQTRANYLKTARSIIRLRHSIAADNEVNEKIPELEEAFDKALHSGRVLDEPALRELIEGVFDAS